MQKNKLKIVKDLGNDKVEVQDLKGLRWIISKAAFKRFKNTGLLFVPDELAATFQNILLLRGGNYATLTKDERHKVLKECLEATVKGPLDSIFPNL